MFRRVISNRVTEEAAKTLSPSHLAGLGAGLLGEGTQGPELAGGSSAR